MYLVHVWNRSEGVEEGIKNQSVYNLSISRDFADLLILSENEELKLISNLTYDDFELFSHSQLKFLIEEFRKLKEINSEYNFEIDNIINLIENAYKSNFDILFDPFN